MCVVTLKNVCPIAVHKKVRHVNTDSMRYRQHFVMLGHESRLAAVTSHALRQQA